MTLALLFVLKSLWFILPGFVANAMPVLGKNMLKSLAVPIDGGKTLGGIRIFGDHKTVRGFVLGILGAIVTAGLQALLLNVSYSFAPSIPGPFFHYLTWMPYDRVPWWVIGFLMGFGVLVGDAVKSFFKRRVNIAPGKSWFPFDQLDALVGAYLFLLPVYVVPGDTMLFLLLFVPALHLLSNVVAYRMKWKETWT